jgi:hypothetical protein
MTPIEQEAWALYQQQAAGSPYLVPTWQALTNAQRVYWIRRAMRQYEEPHSAASPGAGLIGVDVDVRLPIVSPELRYA